MAYDATPRLSNAGRSFAEKVKETINENPELFEAVRRFERLQAEYRQLQEARVGSE